jgi:F420-0:gamma-glutamyl ligase
MRFIKVKTRTVRPPREDIYKVLERSLPELQDGDILFVTSKILAIHQGRCVKASAISKADLIKAEADCYVPVVHVPYHELFLTIRDSTLLLSAGIDESNGNGYYILLPENPSQAAKEICVTLKKKYRIKKLAVIITDSHSVPLRYGVLGISLGFYGLEPLLDYRRTRDVFGQKLKYTQANIVDSLSSLAVLLMGEAGERTPLLIARGLDSVRFTIRETHYKLKVSPEKDIYKDLLKFIKYKGKKRLL